MWICFRFPISRVNYVLSKFSSFLHLSFLTQRLLAASPCWYNNHRGHLSIDLSSLHSPHGLQPIKGNHSHLQIKLAAMAFCTKSWGTETSSSCHYASSLSSHYQGNMLSHGLKLKRNVFGVARGCNCKCISGTEALHYSITESEKKFVEILREAQPYIYLHRGSTFVVILSGEVIDGPFLDTILKVSL